MQIFGYIGLIVTLSAGVWAHGDRVGSIKQEPNLTGFLPGNWQHRSVTDEDEGCS